MTERINQRAGRNSVQAASVTTQHNYFYNERPPQSAPPFQVEPLPDHYVDRPAAVDSLRNRLLPPTEKSTVVISALHGLGGIGKTTLAQRIGHLLREEYTDGVLWVTLGQEPDLLSAATEWIVELGDTAARPQSVHAATARLRALLADRRMLLIVDDAWYADHARPFLTGGSKCATLITTRREMVADELGVPLERLDVLDRAQSLELLQLRAGKKFDEETRIAADRLARTVGDLPLALELAAAQIRRRPNLSLNELADDIGAEIAKLEALDSPYYKLKRNVRLDATFNKSLSLLRGEVEEAWYCFVALAVTPEDAAIPAAMAATLWSTTVEEAAQYLDYLRGESLLLPGSPVDVGETQVMTYRLHDLLHDVARRTLEKPEPEGLGMTLREAHRVFLDRLHKKTTDGLWHTLPDDGYTLQRLTWHMVQADRADLLDALFTEETAQAQNGWYATRVAVGQLAGFIEDIGRAWDQKREGASLRRDVFFALVKASVNSVAENLPSALLRRLVEARVWNGRQALTYAMQITAPVRRFQVLCTLAGVLPAEHRRVAIAHLNHLITERMRTTEMTAEALDGRRLKTVAGLLRGSVGWAGIVSDHLHLIPPADLDKLLAHLSDFERVALIERAVPTLETEHARTCAATVSSVADNTLRPMGLLAIASALPVEDRAGIADAVWKCADQIPAITIREAVREQCIELAPQLVDFAMLSSLSPTGARRVMENQGRFLPAETVTAYVSQFEDVAPLIPLLEPIAALLPPDLLARVDRRLLAVYEIIDSLTTKLEIVRIIAPRLTSAQLDGLVALSPAVPTKIEIALAACLTNTKLATHSRMAWLREHIGTQSDTRQSSIGSLLIQSVRADRVAMLQELATVLPPSHSFRLNAALLRVADSERRSRVFGAITGLLRRIEENRDAAILSMADHLNQKEAESLACALPAPVDWLERSQLLLRLAARMAPNKRAVLIEDAAKAVVRDRVTDEALLSFINDAVEIAPVDALPALERLTTKFRSHAVGVRALIAVAGAYKSLPAVLLHDILEKTRMSAGKREIALSELAAVVPPRHLRRVLAAAQEIGDISERQLRELEAATSDADHDAAALDVTPLPGRLLGTRTPMPLGDVVALVDPLMRTIRLADYLNAVRCPEVFCAKVIPALRKIEDAEDRATALAVLAPILPPAGLSLVCDWVETLGNPKEQFELLHVMLPSITDSCFPDLYRVWMRNDLHSPRLASGICKLIPPWFAIQAIRDARHRNDTDRSIVLLHAVKHLEDNELVEAAEDAAALTDATARGRALRAFALHLSSSAKDIRVSSVRTLIRKLASRTREQIVSDFNSISPAVADDRNQRKTIFVEPLTTVMRWWP